MSLEAKSQALKDIVATYDTQWFLGDLSGLMMHIASGRAQDQLGRLSSPARQLYFLGGLLITSDPAKGKDIIYKSEKWDQIVDLLNEIELEYDKLFFPSVAGEVNDEWKKVRSVAMPSFLSYFNQGPLNYEEQCISWTRDLFIQLDTIIEMATGLKTEDFIQFYENIDFLNQRNFQGFMSPKAPLRGDWKKYTKVELINEAEKFGYIPDEKKLAFYHFISDRGIKDRFYAEELVSSNLSIEKISAILRLLTTTRLQTDHIYYTATRPGNPLYEKPIIDIGDGLFQVFEVKQVLHAIENLLEDIVTRTSENTTQYVNRKGKLLEDKIVEFFTNFFESDIKLYQGYYVDGNEQDILILWKKYAFIIEAKGYSLREPLRDPDKAFVRIRDDFKACIGYGYSQTRRVEKKFIEGVPLRIMDKTGNLIEEIDTTLYEEDFSIIVNIKSFGQIQNDLATLLKLESEDDVYPWAIKLDDLEVFLLTLKAHGKNPNDLVNYLFLREQLHDRLICSDELEVCGLFLAGKLENVIKKSGVIATTNDLASIFDEQYYKGMGFKNEKYLAEKKDGKHIFM